MSTWAGKKSVPDLSTRCGGDKCRICDLTGCLLCFDSDIVRGFRLGPQTTSNGCTGNVEKEACSDPSISKECFKEKGSPVEFSISFNKKESSFEITLDKKSPMCKWIDQDSVLKGLKIAPINNNGMLREFCQVLDPKTTSKSVVVQSSCKISLSFNPSEKCRLELRNNNISIYSVVNP